MKSMKHNIVVCNREDFPRQVKSKPGWAYISISATPECAEFWLNDKSESSHYLSSGEDVLNLEFDDLAEDKIYKGHTFKTITQKQAEELFMFIEDHLHMNILVHCKAGKSRSQGVFRYIMDMYSDYYEECEENKQNPCLSPNMEVVRKLKRAYYEKHPFVMEEMKGVQLNLIGHYVTRDFVLKPKKNEVEFLLGVIDGHEDNYYVTVNNENKITYTSVLMGWNLVDFPPIDFIKSIDLNTIIKVLKENFINFSNFGNVNAKPIKLWKEIQEKWD